MNSLGNRILERWGRGSAILLIPYILLIQLAAVSPEVHGFLHGRVFSQQCCSWDHQHAEEEADANNPSSPKHSCAVTLFAAGIASLEYVFIPPRPVFESEHFGNLFVGLFQQFLISHKHAREPPRGSSV